MHSIKGGNTNQKLQEFVYSLGEGAPKRDKPVMAYELAVTEKSRKVGKERRPEFLSIDLLRVFASKFKSIAAKPGLREKLTKKLKSVATDSFTSQIRSKVPTEIEDLGTLLGLNSQNTFIALFDLMLEFRKKMWKEGGGNYKKTSGFDLEQENKNFGSGGYYYDEEFDPEDTRKELDLVKTKEGDEKMRRQLPMSSNYAAIDSLIKEHTLDGVLNRFAAFVLTDKIVDPKVSLASLIGMSDDSGEEFETWI